MDVEIACISEELAGIELISLPTSSAVGGDSMASGVPVKTGLLMLAPDRVQPWCGWFCWRNVQWGCCTLTDSCCWCGLQYDRSDGLTENAGRENDGSICRTWNCKTWNYKTWKCSTWTWRTKNEGIGREIAGEKVVLTEITLQWTVQIFKPTKLSLINVQVGELL